MASSGDEKASGRHQHVPLHLGGQVHRPAPAAQLDEVGVAAGGVDEVAGQQPEVVAQAEDVVVDLLEAELEDADALGPLPHGRPDPPSAVDLGGDDLLELEGPAGQRALDADALGLLDEEVDGDADRLQRDLLVVDDVQDQVVAAGLLDGGGDVGGQQVGCRDRRTAQEITDDLPAVHRASLRTPAPGAGYRRRRRPR